MSKGIRDIKKLLSEAELQSHNVLDSYSHDTHRGTLDILTLMVREIESLRTQVRDLKDQLDDQGVQS